MRLKKRIVLNGVVCSLLPALCTYLSKGNNILDQLQKNQYIGANIDLTFWKEIFFVLSIVFTFILCTCNIISTKSKEEDYHIQRDNLLKQCKDILTESLSSEFGMEHLAIDIRIFVPNITWKNKVVNFLKKTNKVVYIIKNIDKLADAGTTNNLQFEVSPTPCGLVGKCYQTKNVVYDDKLEHTNKTDYSLLEHQISKTQNLKFSLACPIFDANGNITAILAIDSQQHITINEQREEILLKAITNFSQLLYEHVPELFRKKGGLL